MQHSRHCHLLSALQLQSPQLSPLSRHCANLLGFSLFCALGLATDNMGATVLTVTTPWQQCWPSLFTGLGCVNAFKHQPFIDLAVSSIVQSPSNHLCSACHQVHGVPPDC